MTPGRELDKLIAEKVMDWQGVVIFPNGEAKGRPPKWYKMSLIDLPSYSTDISAAWEVIEKLLSDNTNLAIGVCSINYGPDKGKTQVLIPRHPTLGKVETLSTSAPHAICLAALKVVGVEI